MIYFDNAASAPVEPEVVKLINRLIGENYGNPSSIHELGRRSRVLIENSRKKIARLINVSPSEIIFTSGGTEANNHILWSCFLDLKFKHFVTSYLEHPSVLNTLDNLAKHFGIKISYVNHNSKGHIDTSHLEALLKDSPPAVVSLMHANNEIGNLIPLNQVKDICQKHGAVFFSDTVQTIGKFRIEAESFGFDFATASAHKFHGPKGVGFIYAKSTNKMKSFITGGSQEKNLRGGTENVYGIAGMALALEIAMKEIKKNHSYISGLKFKLIDILSKELPEIEFNGDVKNKSLYTIINLRLPKSDKSEMLLANLDIEGIAVSGGNACSSGSNKASHVLKSVGVKPENPSIRVSLSKYNEVWELEKFTKILKKVYF